MLFLSYWDLDIDGYLPEDTGNWVEATYKNGSDGRASHEFYRFTFLVWPVYQETT